MGDIGLEAMVDAAADAVVDRRAGALLVGDIGLVAMVAAAAYAVVVVGRVLYSWETLAW